MGDNKAATLAKAMVELEELYSGIPDESVNLTFEHLANVKQHPNGSQDHHQKKKLTSNNNNNNDMETVTEIANSTLVEEENNVTPLRKIPSLDFSRGLEVLNQHYHHQHHHRLDRINEDGVVNHPFSTNHHHHDRHSGMSSSYTCVAHSAFRHAVESSHDVDAASGRSMASAYQERVVGRRRPGIPHSKICTVCSTHTYFFRHRCLVCGRAYCRQCVRIGMGEMTEGRKCIECLGKRFSQRYIQRAGEVGCFCSRYPSVVRQAEVTWAEKGPRKSGERAYGLSGMKSRSPMGQTTPTGAHSISGPNSFVMSSPYSPYTPTHHHFPF